MKCKVSNKIKQGDFQHCFIKVDRSGIVEITIFKRGWKRPYKAKWRKKDYPHGKPFFDEEIEGEEVIKSSIRQIGLK